MFKFTGDLQNSSAAMARQLKTYVDEYQDRVADALTEEGTIEKNEMQKRTPVWNPLTRIRKGEIPGTLRMSARVLEPVRNGRKISVSIVYTDPKAPYVHEDLDAVHAIGEAKFMESTLHESQPHMAERLGARLQLGKK